MRLIVSATTLQGYSRTADLLGKPGKGIVYGCYMSVAISWNNIRECDNLVGLYMSPKPYTSTELNEQLLGMIC